MNFQVIIDTLVALLTLYATARAAYTHKRDDWRMLQVIFVLVVIQAIWNAVQPTWNIAPLEARNGLFLIALGVEGGRSFWRVPSYDHLFGSALAFFVGTCILGQYIPISIFGKFILFICNIILWWAYYQFLYFQALRRFAPEGGDEVA